MNNVFLTGSHAYGQPDEYSDFDIVVRGTREFAENLVNKGWYDCNSEYNRSPNDMTILRIDRVNLLVCHTDEVFEAWHEGTASALSQYVVSKKPVSTERASELMIISEQKRGIVR